METTAQAQSKPKKFVCKVVFDDDSGNIRGANLDFRYYVHLHTGQHCILIRRFSDPTGESDSLLRFDNIEVARSKWRELSKRYREQGAALTTVEVAQDVRI